MNAIVLLHPFKSPLPYVSSLNLRCRRKISSRRLYFLCSLYPFFLLLSFSNLLHNRIAKRKRFGKILELFSYNKFFQENFNFHFDFHS